MADNQDLEELAGQVERIVFHNSDNGFTVLRLLPQIPEDKKEAKNGQKRLFAPEPANCVGVLVEPKPGVKIRLTGHWVNNPKFGRQFAFESAEELLPATEEGIRLYLASGLIRGVGDELAGRIVDKFGKDSIRILDEEPEKLLQVRGVGRKSLEGIVESWNAHHGMRDLMLFLQPHGISCAQAVRVYKNYGADALDVVRKNPFRLAMDVRGIGFLTADQIAGKLGFAADNPLRLEAAVLYVLYKSTDDGHVYLPKSRVCEEAARHTGLPPEDHLPALDSLAQNALVIREDLEGEDDEAVYLGRFHHCEEKIAYYLRRILNSPKSVSFANPDEAVDKVAASLKIELAEEQKEAIRIASRAKILAITGGPGTGKTTIIDAIIRIFDSAKARILLAAPTGRAARRMAETSGKDAKTIHRLLEYSPKEECFGKNEDNPLACGLLVVDEASMMDTLLFFHLLKAVPLGATVILVGDVNQLPSVGPGNVLADIIQSGVIPVARLSHIFRQSAESEIICNAHMINAGKVPDLTWNRDRLSDFYFISQSEPEKAAELIVDLVRNHIPRRFGLDSINDVQVLTPMHKGAVGAQQMNARLQDILNPQKREVRKGDRAFRLHDKVMQVRNNYEKDIFNGDMGRISHLDLADRLLSVDFDGRIVPYEFDELDELAPAYAISIHKSQGSEYPAVVIPIMMQHYVLLQRNLIYTAVTRGKKLVILVGEPRALHVAVGNNKTQRRFTRLCERLAGNIPPRGK